MVRSQRFRESLQGVARGDVDFQLATRRAFEARHVQQFHHPRSCRDVGHGCLGRAYPRSTLSASHGLTICNGWADPFAFDRSGPIA